MDPALSTKALLRRFDLQPKKSLGQSFLIDPRALEKVVQAGDITAGDTVLEVGAGLGGLTRLLAAHAGQVIAVELDRRLIGILEEVLAPFSNVRIVHGDILELDLSRLLIEAEVTGDYLVVANIPYYITGSLIRRLLEAERPPRRLALTVQREVADRICSRPPDMNLLGLSVQIYGRPAQAGLIPAEAFYPAPNVDSAIVVVKRHPEPILESEQLARFFKLIKAGFGQKRKMLANALSAGLQVSKVEISADLERAGIDPRRRAETLELEEWVHLIYLLKSL